MPRRSAKNSGTISKHRSRGIVLIVFVVLIFAGASTLFLSAGRNTLQKQQQLKQVETRKRMLDIREAIYGFTLGLSNRLPCPDINDDGLEDRSSGSCSSAQGDIPWLTLGVEGQDSWHQDFIYRVTLEYGDDVDGAPPCATTPSGVSFSSCSNGNITLYDSASLSTVIESNIPAIVISRGRSRGFNSTDETENTDNDTSFVIRYFSETSGSEFNDLVYTISNAQLIQYLQDASIL